MSPLWGVAWQPQHSQAVGLSTVDKGNGRCRLTITLRSEGQSRDLSVNSQFSNSGSQTWKPLESSGKVEAIRLYLSLVPLPPVSKSPSGPTQSYAPKSLGVASALAKFLRDADAALFENHPLRKLV